MLLRSVVHLHASHSIEHVEPVLIVFFLEVLIFLLLQHIEHNIRHVASNIDHFEPVVVRIVEALLRRRPQLLDRRDSKYILIEL